MSELRLSIVLVTWNSVRASTDLLESLLALTCTPHELLVVDNASTDGTLDLLRRAANLSRLRLIENASNERCARATNQALAVARGELVVYLCASHAIVTERGWDLTLLRYMDEHDDVDLAGDVWNPYGFMLPSRRYQPGWTPQAHGRDRLEHVQGGAWIARRRLFEEVGGFAEDEYPHGGMDVEFSYRLLSHGKRLGRCRAIASPPSPKRPALAPGVVVYHPADERVRGVARRHVALASRATSARTAPGISWPI